MPYSSGRSLPATLGGDGCSAVPIRPPDAPVYDPLPPYAPVYDPLVVLRQAAPSALWPATLDAESLARPISTMPAIVASAPACPATPRLCQLQKCLSASSPCQNPRPVRCPPRPHRTRCPAEPSFTTSPDCCEGTPFHRLVGASSKASAHQASAPRRCHSARKIAGRREHSISPQESKMCRCHSARQAWWAPAPRH